MFSTLWLIFTQQQINQLTDAAQAEPRAPRERRSRDRYGRDRRERGPREEAAAEAPAEAGDTVPMAMEGEATEDTPPVRSYFTLPAAPVAAPVNAPAPTPAPVAESAPRAAAPVAGDDCRRSSTARPIWRGTLGESGRLT